MTETSLGLKKIDGNENWRNIFDYHNDSMDAAETEIKKRIKSINGIQADADGDAKVSMVDYAYNLASKDNQTSDGIFVERTTGGSASLADGDAWLATISGNRVHTGKVNESLEMTVTPTSGSEISAVIDRGTFVAAASGSGTYTFTYNGSAWSLNPATYGITVSGTPISGDVITVVYVAEARGTITPANPRKFVSTGWNLYNHTNGYARVLKYRDNATFGISGTYTSVQFSETLAGTRTAVTVTSGTFTISTDGYIWVTGGNDTDTAIWMTWSDWTSGYDGNWEEYSETEVDISALFGSGNFFPYGLLRVGGVADTINFDTGVATSNIDRIAYSAANLATVKGYGVEYECDEDYIYYVKTTPDTESFTIDKSYAAFDHGMEYFTNTTVGCYVSMLYGRNLAEYLAHDVPNLFRALVLKGSTTTISANGTTTVSLSGLTADYEVMKFGCSTGENNPGANVEITTGANSYTIVVTNYYSSFTITPVFIRYMS